MSSHHKIDVILKNSFSTFGEGPHWESFYQRIVCVDILNGGVFHVYPETQDFTEIHLDGTVGFVIPRSKGGYVVGLNKSVAALDFGLAATETIVEVDEGTQNRFNDGKCDSSGRLWAGTLGHRTAAGTIEMGLGSLYSLSADKKVTRHLTKLGISNGLDWSNDDTVMYYIDSVTQKVVAFDFDLNNGTIDNQRTVVSNDEKGVVPYGMCVDAEGKLWVAYYAGSRVSRIDPETGKILQNVTFPVTNITSCCFGGKNLDELYVTSGRYGIPDSEVQERQPLAGSLFRVTGLGVKGRQMNNFEG